jgi:RecB family endonuclease NucS
MEKTLNVAIKPSIDESLKIMQDSIAKRKTLIVVGACEVEYKGRAESRLGLGERILLIKSDRAVLIHRSTGYEPVNWQPSGCMFHTRSTDNRLIISATNLKTKENLKLTFAKVDLAAQLELKDTSEFVLYSSEEDMQKAIMLNPELVEGGFHPISKEKKTLPGFVDVFGKDKFGKFVVVEIKRRTASKDAVLQLWKYIQTIDETKQGVRGILVAPRMAKEAGRLLRELNLEFKELSPKKCSKMLGKAGSVKLLRYLNK